MGEPGRLQSMGLLSWTRLSDFIFTFHFYALEKEMATHSSVLACRIPGTVEPDGLPSLGSHRVGQAWRDLAAAAAAMNSTITEITKTLKGTNSRLSETKEWISDLEERMTEIIEAEQNKEKRMRTVRGFRGNTEHTILRNIGVPEEEGKKKERVWQNIWDYSQKLP